MPAGSRQEEARNGAAMSGEKTLNWQMEHDQNSSITTKRDHPKGKPWREEKKVQHKFSNAMPESKDFRMEQFMKESQAPRGTAPWVPVWTFPKSGDGKKGT